MKIITFFSYCPLALACSAFLLATALPAKAQDDLYHNFNYGGSNILWCALANIGGLLKEPYTQNGADIKILSLKENGEKVENKDHYYSLKGGHNLFHYFVVAKDIGWMHASPESFVSCFVLAGRISFVHQEDKINLSSCGAFRTFKSNALEPGAAIKLEFLDTHVHPCAGFGATYTLNLGSRTPFGRDKKQFNNGFNYHVGAGFRTKDFSLLLEAKLPGFNYFNKEWEGDGGERPYANVEGKSRLFTVAIGFRM